MTGSKLKALFLFTAAAAAAQNDPGRKEWVQLFNGANLDGWVVKLAGHELGDNYGDTFRVDNGVIKVSYDKYPEFGNRFGHLFYRQKFSHYVVAVEYRFTGEQARGGPGYALLNSGVMIHSQAPETIRKEQNWPISIEAQFLANTTSMQRRTANVCTPGTEIFMNGQMVKAHCTNSTSDTYSPGRWVRVEVEVLGSERIRHIIDGRTVLEYEKPQIGGGVVNNFDPTVKKDGTLLEEGYIGLQSESQPVEFRKVELLNLSGCMDPKAANFKSYFVHRNDSGCVYSSGTRR
jgi:hypothetical protein